MPALGAGVGREMRRAAMLALPLGLLVMIVNALVVRDGLTVIARLGTCRCWGRPTSRSRRPSRAQCSACARPRSILCGALYTAAVDPDEVLRLFRRFSFHSALTATLATRMVPVLARDSRRLADAQRCRPAVRAPSRVQLMRAATSGVLDRALDVAAALEVRGYGRRPRPAAAGAAPSVLASRPRLRRGRGGGPRAGDRRPRSRGGCRSSPYPALHAPIGAGGLAVAVGLVACALLPFADRRGIGR